MIAHGFSCQISLKTASVTYLFTVQTTVNARVYIFPFTVQVGNNLLAITCSASPTQPVALADQVNIGCTGNWPVGSRFSIVVATATISSDSPSPVTLLTLGDAPSYLGALPWLGGGSSNINIIIQVSALSPTGARVSTTVPVTVRAPTSSVDQLITSLGTKAQAASSLSDALDVLVFAGAIGLQVADASDGGDLAFVDRSTKFCHACFRMWNLSSSTVAGARLSVEALVPFLTSSRALNLAPVNLFLREFQLQVVPFCLIASRCSPRKSSRSRRRVPS